MDLGPTEVQAVPGKLVRDLNFTEYDVYDSVELVGTIVAVDKSFDGISRSACQEVATKMYYPVILETITTNQRANWPDQEGVVVMIPEDLFDDEKLINPKATVHVCGYLVPSTLFCLRCRSVVGINRAVHHNFEGMKSIDYTVVVVATRVDLVSEESIVPDECDSMVVLKGYVGMHEDSYYAPTEENKREKSFFGRPNFPLTFKFMSCTGIPDIDYRFKKSTEYTEYNPKIWSATVLAMAVGNLGYVIKTLPVGTEVVIGGRLMPTFNRTSFSPSYFPAVRGDPRIEGALGILVHSIDIIGDIKE